MSLPQVAVISLGGTIACAPDDRDRGLVPVNDPTSGIDDDQVEILSVPWSLTDSTEITFNQLVQMAERARELEAAGADGVIVTQGTDTLDDVAWALSLLRPTRQPIVLTGAMRAPSTPGSDGDANLRAATATAILPALAEHTSGAVLVMNDQIHSARWVQKGHTQSPDAFTSGEAGVLGVISEGRPVLLRRDLETTTPRFDIRPEEPMPRVALLPAVLDQDAALFDAVLDLGYAGLVVEGLGGGHVDGATASRLGRIAEHLPVVFAAKPRRGIVLSRTYASPGAELDLISRGCLPAGSLPASKARILLTLLLGTGQDRRLVEQNFQSMSITTEGTPR